MLERKNGALKLFSVLKCRLFFKMSLLIYRGADIEKKTQGFKDSPLHYAGSYNDAHAIEVLLKHGANRTELSYSLQQPALHIACDKYNLDIIQVLLDYGVDVNITDGVGNGPLRWAHFEVKEVLLRELAILKFEGRNIQGDNMNYMQENKKTKKYFDLCLKELKVMKNCNVFNNLSLYDILKMQKNYKKLVSLMKNEKFVAALELSRKRVSKSIKLYEYHLEDLIDKIMKKKDILRAEEIKLYSVFKNLLPELIIHRVAYFSTEY